MMNFNEFLMMEGADHKLSGVVLIFNNKILLVRPKKFKDKMKKWSIPKGHIEENLGKIETALHELEEESRIELTKKHLKEAEKYILTYKKGNNEKKLTCFIVRVTKKDMNIRLFNNMILGNFLKAETREAGFFDKKDAELIIEKHQLELLKFLK